MKKGSLKSIFLKIGSKSLILVYSSTKYLLIFIIFSYICKYPKEALAMPVKFYRFSVAFYTVFESKASSFYKKKGLRSVFDKSKEIIYDFADKNTYYDLDDHLNGKFYKTFLLIVGVALFIYNYPSSTMTGPRYFVFPTVEEID